MRTHHTRNRQKQTGIFLVFFFSLVLTCLTTTQHALKWPSLVCRILQGCVLAHSLTVVNSNKINNQKKVIQKSVVNSIQFMFITQGFSMLSKAVWSFLLPQENCRGLSRRQHICIAKDISLIKQFGIFIRFWLLWEQMYAMRSFCLDKVYLICLPQTEQITYL